MTITQLAEKSGIARGTFYKWIKGTTGVTVEYVRRVAKASGRDLNEVLKAAGGSLIDENEDPQLRDIYAADISDEEKQELVDYVLEERMRNEDALRRQVRKILGAHERRAS